MKLTKRQLPKLDYTWSSKKQINPKAIETDQDASPKQSERRRN